MAYQFNSHLIWVPVHWDIIGNCKAKELAKIGTSVEIPEEFDHTFKFQFIWETNRSSHEITPDDQNISFSLDGNENVSRTFKPML